MSNLPEYIDGLPNISGAEKEIEGALSRRWQLASALNAAIRRLR